MTWVETIPWSSVLRFHVDQQWDTLTFTHSLWLHLRVTFSVSSGDPGDRDGNSKKKHMSSFLIWYNLSCAVLCLVTQSCLTLCDPMDCSPPGSPVQGVYQARILEWVAMPSSRGSSRPRDWNQVSHIAGGFFSYNLLEDKQATFLFNNNNSSLTKNLHGCLTCDVSKICCLEDGRNWSEGGWPVAENQVSLSTKSFISYLDPLKGE